VIETYRGWEIRPNNFPYLKCMTFEATSPDYNPSYEGPEDGWLTCGHILTAETVDELKKLIDDHIEENAD
jgi:hypothetical protein